MGFLQREVAEPTRDWWRNDIARYPKATTESRPAPIPPPRPGQQVFPVALGTSATPLTRPEPQRQGAGPAAFDSGHAIALQRVLDENGWTLEDFQKEKERRAQASLGRERADVGDRSTQPVLPGDIRPITPTTPPPTLEYVGPTPSTLSDAAGRYAGPFIQAWNSDPDPVQNMVNLLTYQGGTAKGRGPLPSLKEAMFPKEHKTPGIRQALGLEPPPANLEGGVLPAPTSPPERLLREGTAFLYENTNPADPLNWIDWATAGAGAIEDGLLRRAATGAARDAGARAPRTFAEAFSRGIRDAASEAAEAGLDAPMRRHTMDVYHGPEHQVTSAEIGRVMDRVDPEWRAREAQEHLIRVASDHLDRLTPDMLDRNPIPPQVASGQGPDTQAAAAVRAQRAARRAQQDVTMEGPEGQVVRVGDEVSTSTGHVGRVVGIDQAGKVTLRRAQGQGEVVVEPEDILFPPAQEKAPVAPPEATGQQPVAGPARVPVSPDPAQVPDVHPELGGTRVPSESPPGHGSVVEVDPDDVLVDAKTYQFKSGGDAQGVTDRLRDVQKWDPVKSGKVIVHQRKDGKLYIVDGHQRLAFAKRAKAAGQDVYLDAMVFQESAGHSPADMRIMAAGKNLAENSGTAIDAARIIREAGEDHPYLQDIPRSSTVFRDGSALARLGDDAFEHVVNEAVPSNYAAHVGRLLEDPAEQVAAIRALERARPQNSAQALSIVQDVKAVGFARRNRNQVAPGMEQGDLFGDAGIVIEDLLGERAVILDAAARAIRNDKRLFRAIVEGEGRLSDAGNVLAKDSNRGRLTADEQLLRTLEDAKYVGPVADSLNDAARRLKSGESRSRSVEEFLRVVREQVLGDVQPREVPGRSSLEPGGGAEAGRVAESASVPDNPSGAPQAGLVEGQQVLVRVGKREVPGEVRRIQDNKGRVLVRRTDTGNVTSYPMDKVRAAEEPQAVAGAAVDTLESRQPATQVEPSSAPTSRPAMVGTTNNTRNDLTFDQAREAARSPEFQVFIRDTVGHFEDAGYHVTRVIPQVGTFDSTFALLGARRARPGPAAKPVRPSGQAGRRSAPVTGAGFLRLGRLEWT